MTITAPLIDPRTANDVTDEVKALLKVYAPAYKGVGPASGDLVPDPLGAALIGVFGRLTELVIQRLNRVPEKNFLAFLDLLGASQLPPQPARVPLTFFLAAGSAVPGVVPAGTQVAAPPDKGERDPIVFETERELVVTPARLTAVLVRDPEADTYADHGALVSSPEASDIPLFRGNRPLDHVLYLGLRELLGFQGITTLQLTFEIGGGLVDPRQVRWERWDGSAWAGLTTEIVGDTTQGLRLSGSVSMGSLPTVPLGSVEGVESRWLRGRLLTPINPSGTTRVGMLKASELPSVQAITAAVTVKRTGLPVDAAYTNASPLDPSKHFFPFGEGPRFGDTFWVRADEPLSVAGADVSVKVVLANPATTGPSTATPPPTKASADLKLAWEIWNGSAWHVLGTSMSVPPVPPPTSGFQDETLALTKSGSVRLRCPAQVTMTTVNGAPGFWLRTRIIAGDYGKEAQYVPNGDAGFRFTPATFQPPVIESVAIEFELSKSAPPDARLAFNDFRYTRIETLPFAPFRATEDAGPTAYLGFALPPGVAGFPNRPVSLFSRAADLRYGERTVPLSPTGSTTFGVPAATVNHRFWITNPNPVPASVACAVVGTAWTPAPVVPPTLGPLAPGATAEVVVGVIVPAATPPGSRDSGLLAVVFSTQPDLQHTASFTTVASAEPAGEDPVGLAWEYWNGTRWGPVMVRDDTDQLVRSGTLDFLAPPDLAAREDFGVGPRYWVRVRREKGEYVLEPRLRRLLLNTVLAAQSVTVRGEILGSSDGSERQGFRTTRAPILPGQRLQVREPELPPAAERAELERVEGADAVTIGADVAGQTGEIWVRWHEVTDFYGSGPRDRHYVLDRFSGEVRLGDGRNGLVPPTGVGNLRLTYRTGGGTRGNRPAGTLVQLKTTVPYVDKVTNSEPATGGADAESLDSLIARAPREVRHGGRAVTLEDYEDLALLASPEVARAKCVPLANLAADPLGEDPAAPGEVSVIIVPRSAESKPLPRVELIRLVQTRLDTHRVPTARLTVVGPLYIRVEVKAVVAVASLEGASEVLARVQETVAAFLHPLTGGLDGTGWDFGRRPHRSDLYALIEAATGVDHVRSLDVVEVEDQPGVALTGRFLVYPGSPRISVVFEEA